MNKLIKSLSNFGLIEQSLISLLNFFIIFLNGKFLSVKDFADFIVIFSSLTFVFLIVSSLWANPILVFLSTKFKDENYKYLNNIYWMNLVTSILLGIITLILVDVFVRNISFSVFCWALLTIVLWCQYELLRKQSYAKDSLSKLMNASIFLVLLYFIGNLVFNYQLTLTISYLLLTISYIFPIVYVITSQRIKHKKQTNLLSENVERSIIVKSHWDFAKWTILGSGFYWFSTQGYFILVANILSDIELGALRTTLNVLGLISIFLVLFENKQIPKASKIYFEKKENQLKVYISSLSKKYLLPFLVLITITCFISYMAFDLVFGEQFSNYKYLIVIFGVYQLILGLNRPSVVALRSMNRTKFFYVSNLLSAIATVTIGLILASEFTVLGAALSMVVSASLSTIYFIISYKKVTRV
ncbi:lipopolysaccharide biosynthesis protein [Metabacillus rhizolycopersici]|uniref:Polysaccharide biosynthesis protein C-terminal domain-containing protein n=1 Tax=Metabacillus rhizolycopersici TaxID=2875709 RepID=A0ABS7ULX2_9BACI|nr:hypothetical protein [Metabacillus rhizolycopersici]MBZ5749057.1 hypothetical protein [Metabacillus rhizolycopersici]